MNTFKTKIPILMRITFLSIAVLLLLASCGDRKSENTEPPSRPPINLLIFADFAADGPSLGVAKGYIKKLLQELCQVTTDQKINVEVLPIWKNTGNAQPIMICSIDGEEKATKGDLFCQNKNAEFNRLITKGSKELDDPIELYRLLETLDVLPLKLSSIDLNTESLTVLILSNFLERNSPVAEADLRFNFVKEGQDILNDYSLNAITAQLKDQHSPLLDKLDEFKEATNGKQLDKIEVILVNLRTVSGKIKETDHWNYSRILTFWNKLYTKAGFSQCKIISIEHLDKVVDVIL